MRYMLTDDLWAAMGPLVEKAKWYKGWQPPDLPDRDFFEALFYLARTGIPWRDLPSEFGAWDAVYKRFRRWVRSGGLKTLFELMTADPAFGDVRRVLIDSTIVRAHQHAAGARRRGKKDRGRAVGPASGPRPEPGRAQHESRGRGRRRGHGPGRRRGAGAGG
jgi:transposase